MLKRRWGQMALALLCFCLPLAWATQAGNEPTAGVWLRGEFEKSRVTHLVMSGEGEHVIRYAALEGRGVFRNTEDFGFWANKSGGLPTGALGRIGVRGLVTSRRNPRLTLVALDNGGQNGGIYRTPYMGAPWTLVDWTLAGHGQAVVIAPLAEGEAQERVYAAVSGKLYRSDDAGESWGALEPLPKEGVIQQLAVDPMSADTLYVTIQRAGLFRTADAGASWEAIGEGLDECELLSLLVVPPHEQAAATRVLYLGTDRGLYQLRQEGTGWSQELRWPPAGPHRRICALAIDPSHPGVLYAGVARGGIYRSGDEGVQWEQMNRGLGSADVYVLAFDPAAPEYLYAGTSDGVWRCAVSPLVVPTPASATKAPTAEPTATGTQQPGRDASPTATKSAEPSLSPTTAATATAVSTSTQMPDATGSPGFTDTPLPPTDTPSATLVAPTPTRRNTTAPPTAPATAIPPATATPPLTATPPATATFTRVPPPPANTPVPPTLPPPTATPVPPTPTLPR